MTMVKKGIKSLQARGWFCVQPAFDAEGDRAPNRYFPVWKRAEGQAPAGSERPRRAPRLNKAPADPITFEAGVIRLTAAEVADIEAKVGDLAWPFFDGLKRNPQIGRRTLGAPPSREPWPCGLRTMKPPKLRRWKLPDSARLKTFSGRVSRHWGRVYSTRGVGSS